MKQIILFSIVFVIGFFSCNKKERPIADTIISVDFDKNGNLNISDIFSNNIEYISLESPENHLIGEVSKLVVTKNYICIADYYNTSSIFIFSREGKFISQIYRVGEGPFEYEVLKDFYFDEKNMEVGVFSLYGKWIVYKITGECLQETFTDLIAVKFQKMGDNIFVSGVDSDYWLHVLSENSTKEDKYFPNLNNRFALDFGPFNSFSGTEDSVLYLPNLQQVFYCFTNGKYFSKYQIDFGEHEIPTKLINDCKNFDEYLNLCKKGGYAHVIDKFSETEKYLYCNYTLNNKTRHIFYNRKTKEVVNAMNIVNDVDGIEFYGLDGQYEYGIIQTRWPTYIKENLKRLQKNMTKDEWAEYIEKNSELIKISSKAKNTDNPIIMIYNYK